MKNIYRLNVVLVVIAGLVSEAQAAPGSPNFIVFLTDDNSQ